MAVQLPFKPLMVFVLTEQPTLVATFAQKAISDIKPGTEAEVVFKAHPGKSFKVKVRRVMTAIPEGEIVASGQLLSATPASDHGDVPVVFDYGEDVAELKSARRFASKCRHLHRPRARAIDRAQDHLADEELGEFCLLGRLRSPPQINREETIYRERSRRRGTGPCFVRRLPWNGPAVHCEPSDNRHTAPTQNALNCHLGPMRAQPVSHLCPTAPWTKKEGFTEFAVNPYASTSAEDRT